MKRFFSIICLVLLGVALAFGGLMLSDQRDVRHFLSSFRQAYNQTVADHCQTVADHSDDGQRAAWNQEMPSVWLPGVCAFPMYRPGSCPLDANDHSTCRYFAPYPAEAFSDCMAQSGPASATSSAGDTVYACPSACAAALPFVVPYAVAPYAGSPCAAAPVRIVTEPYGNAPPSTIQQSEVDDVAACEPQPSPAYADSSDRSQVFQFFAQAPRGRLGKADHLTAAANHLEAAGLQEEAAKLREQAQFTALPAEAGQGRGRASAPKQIIAHITAVEIDCSKLRDLGIDFSEIAGSRVSGLLNSQATSAPSIETNTINVGVADRGSCLLGLVNALKKNHVARLLAEPTLVAVSGRPTRFQCGGKIPLSVAKGDGTFGEELHDYGTNVELVSSLLDNGNIRAEIRLSLVEINGTMTLNGRDVPKLTTRTVDTGVELKLGQTFVLGGLMQSSYGAAKQCVCQEKVTASDEREAELCDGDERTEAERNTEENCPGSPECHAQPDQKESQLLVLVHFELANTSEGSAECPQPVKQALRPYLPVPQPIAPWPARQPDSRH